MDLFIFTAGGPVVILLCNHGFRYGLPSFSSLSIQCDYFSYLVGENSVELTSVKEGSSVLAFQCKKCE